MTNNIKYIIGIDLGTTNLTCCVGVIEEGKISSYQHSIAQLINVDGNPSIKGDTILPSIVLIKENNVFTGRSVYEFANRLAQIPDCALIKSVKNFIGDDYWRCNSNGKSFNSIEVTSFLLRTIYESLQKEIKDEDIEKIIITIPAKCIFS